MVEENDEDENSRGFTAAYDHQDHHTFRNTQSFIGGSPTSSANVHRGYSLLNQPNKVKELQDSDEEPSGLQSPVFKASNGSKPVTASGHGSSGEAGMTPRIEISNGSLAHLPDLLFCGFGIQALQPDTVEQRREKRQKRQRKGEETRRKIGSSQHLSEEKQDGSTSNQLTSLTDKQKVSKSICLLHNPHVY